MKKFIKCLLPVFLVLCLITGCEEATPEAPTFRVIFHPENGEADIIVVASKLELPENPSKATYTFRDWVDMEGKPLDASLVGKPLTKDLEFKAVYDEIPVDHASGVKSEEELIAAIGRGGEIRLDADITVTAPIDVAKSLKLYLNGHTLLNGEGLRGRTLNISADNVKISVDGTAEGSRWLASAPGTTEDAKMSFGLINIASDGFELELNGGEYGGNTDYGALFKTGNVMDSLKITMKGVTSHSNRPVVYMNNSALDLSIRVEDSEFVSRGSFLSQPESYVLFLVGGDGTEGLESPDVVFSNCSFDTNGATSSEFAAVWAEFNNCTVKIDCTTSPEWISSAMSSSNGAVVDLRGGSFVSDKYGAFIWNSGGTINIRDGAVVKGQLAGAKADTVSTTPAIINIYDGEVTGPVMTSNNGKAASTVTVVGGRVDGELRPQKPGDLVITGGTFTADPTAYVDSEAYTVTEKDGEWTVTAK